MTLIGHGYFTTKLYRLFIYQNKISHYCTSTIYQISWHIHIVTHTGHNFHCQQLHQKYHIEKIQHWVFTNNDVGKIEFFEVAATMCEFRAETAKPIHGRMLQRSAQPSTALAPLQ